MSKWTNSGPGSLALIPMKSKSATTGQKVELAALCKKRVTALPLWSVLENLMISSKPPSLNATSVMAKMRDESADLLTLANSPTLKKPKKNATRNAASNNAPSYEDLHIEGKISTIRQRSPCVNREPFVYTRILAPATFHQFFNQERVSGIWPYINFVNIRNSCHMSGHRCRSITIEGQKCNIRRNASMRCRPCRTQVVTFHKRDVPTNTTIISRMCTSCQWSLYQSVLLCLYSLHRKSGTAVGLDAACGASSRNLDIWKRDRESVLIFPGISRPERIN